MQSHCLSVLNDAVFDLLSFFNFARCCTTLNGGSDEGSGSKAVCSSCKTVDMVQQNEEEGEKEEEKGGGPQRKPQETNQQDPATPSLNH